MPRVRNPRKCISCGHQTSSPVSICYRCPTIKIDQVSLEFIDQFIGLFLGEGSISIALLKPNQFRARPTTRLVMSLVQREDDIANLQAIQKYLGGNINVDNHRNRKNPVGRWTLTRHANQLDVLRAVQARALLPARKLNDVDIALEWLGWKLGQPFHNYDPAPGFVLRERLMVLRPYNTVRGYAL